jgi:hypothetical protein
MTRRAAGHSADLPVARTPWGRATQATIPNRAELMASPMNSHLNEYFARKPAVAGPNAHPAFYAQR